METLGVGRKVSEVFRLAMCSRCSSRSIRETCPPRMISVARRHACLKVAAANAAPRELPSQLSAAYGLLQLFISAISRI